MKKKIYLSGKGYHVFFEIEEVKSYKYRVLLENGKMSPWQYSDHVPDQKELVQDRKYYDDLNKKRAAEKITETFDKKTAAKFDELEKKLVKIISKEIPSAEAEAAQKLTSDIHNQSSWNNTVKDRFKKDFNALSELKTKEDKSLFVDYLMKKYKDSEGLFAHLAAVVKDSIVHEHKKERTGGRNKDSGGHSFER